MWMSRVTIGLALLVICEHRSLNLSPLYCCTWQFITYVCVAAQGSLSWAAVVSPSYNRFFPSYPLSFGTDRAKKHKYGGIMTVT